MRTMLVVFFMLAVLTSVTAEEKTTDIIPPVFNEKLTTEERSQLLRGETLIRNVGKMKNVCIDPSYFEVDFPVRSAYEKMKELDPAYLAEIIQLRPVEGNENLPTELHDAVLDVKSYIGIPYWSVRSETFYDLYSDAEITSSEIIDGTEYIQADLTMSPFGVIKASIESILKTDSFYYQLINQNDLYYHDRFKCVSDECMLSTVTIERVGDYWLLYGLGGVDALSIFFLRDRIETSFINRIKTFCVYFFDKK